MLWLEWLSTQEMYAFFAWDMSWGEIWKQESYLDAKFQELSQEILGHCTTTIFKILHISLVFTQKDVYNMLCFSTDVMSDPNEISQDVLV